MGSFAEQPSIRFYIGSIPKSMVDSLSNHASGFTFDIPQERCWIAVQSRIRFKFDVHLRSWQIAEQLAIGKISDKDTRALRLKR